MARSRAWYEQSCPYCHKMSWKSNPPGGLRLNLNQATWVCPWCGKTITVEKRRYARAK